MFKLTMVNTGKERHSYQSFSQQILQANFDNDFAIVSMIYNYNDDQFYYDLMEFEFEYKDRFQIKIKPIKDMLSVFPNYKIYIRRIDIHLN